VARFNVVQLNVARLRSPLDSPELSDFVAWLEPINAIADHSPGFVWRLQTDEGNATSIRVFDDDMMIVNMSAWESVEALAGFVYGSDHRSVFARRKEWFERIEDAYVVLWWLPAEEVPTVEEGRRRLEQLRANGPTADAFTIKTWFPPPTGP
jgi:hypothetical protein